jgi:hypothetical protein
MNKEFSQTQFDFTPLISITHIYALVFLCLAAVVFFVAFRQKALLPRAIALVALILTLLNTSILSTTTHKKDGVVLIVADESYSNDIDGRDLQTQAALDALTQKIDKQAGIDYKIIHAPAAQDKFSETNLFTALDKELSNTPPKQRSGVVIISDGNIHDIPELEVSQLRDKYGPIHHVLTGKANEKDRRLEIKKSPLYGLKGTEAQIDFVVHDTTTPFNTPVKVTISTPNGKKEEIIARIGKKESIYVPIEHAGVNPVELYAQPLQGEISIANNRRAVLIQGVRDKLNVLLVSGAPHEGGRYWRSLLTSDAAIELIHFTILRDIDSRDNTPRNEMALIPFPHQQLFHKQLDNFDLIIFDRYRNQGILQDKTYQNIANYVRSGGALLVASGPEYLSDKSVYQTPLKDVLLGAPAHDLYETAFKPTRTARGKTHPITRSIASGEFDGENWANWLRQIQVTTTDNNTLLNGYDNQPLLLIGEKDDGRVIQLTSDQIWLWAREYKQGGPYIDLMRKMIHWLLKEPSLEEGQIELSLDGETIRVKRYAALNGESVSYTAPSGEEKELALKPSPDGLFRGSVKAEEQGLYSFKSGGNSAYIIHGAYDTVEQTTLIRTKKITNDIVRYTGGTHFDADKIEGLNTKLLTPSFNKRYYGLNTVAFRESQYAETLKINFASLLPYWAYFLLCAMFMLYAWHRESR